VDQQASATLYLQVVSKGVVESSRGLTDLAKSAVDAGKELHALKQGASFFPGLAREATQATQQLERMKRVLSEGRTSVFFSDLQRGFSGVGRVGTVAFGALTAGVGGWVRAGLQGTAELQQFHRSVQFLSYDIASIFTPWIQRAIDLVGRLADKLRGCWHSCRG
jgi:hypothetical protein